MNNPFDVARPRSLQLGQLSGSMGALMKQFAWALGERYNGVLSRQPHPLGPAWLDRLGQYRNQNLSLHDPSFVIGEPEHYTDSVVWRALPSRTPHLVNEFRRVRITRNRWEHDAVRQDSKSFKEGVLRVRVLAESLQETEVISTCDDLIERLEDLKAGARHKTLPDPKPDVIAELDLMRKQAEQEAERSSAALAELRKQIKKEGAAGAALIDQLEAQQRDLDDVQAKAKDLQEQLYLALQEKRLISLEPADDLQPGEEWDGPLPAKVWHLKKRIVDLVDPESRTLLSDEYGSVVRDASRRWLKLMPTGGRVHITDAGNATGSVAGRYVYLGRLDDALLEAEGLQREDATGALMYELTPDLDLLDYETGDLVSDRLGKEAQRIGSRLSTTLSPGERFRLTSGGHALVVRDGQLRDLGSVAPDGLG